jgi:hypothetical protein
MKEYLHQESDYIDSANYKAFNEFLVNYDFLPEEIQDEKDFNFVLNYLLGLSLRAPNFILLYEYVLGMLNRLKATQEIDELKNNLEQRKIAACDYVAQKDDIFNKNVVWAFHENRPLIRGLMSKADRIWESGQVKEAHELFSKIYKTNKNDNVGARYSMKATAEGMSFDEFEERFTYHDEHGSYYKTDEIISWFDKK